MTLISALALPLSALAGEAAAERDFRFLDRDRDERLSRFELESFPHLGQWFDAADRDGSGTLSREEFVALLSQPGVVGLPE